MCANVNINFFLFLDESNDVEWEDIDEDTNVIFKECIFCDRQLRRDKRSVQKISKTTTDDVRNRIIRILEILHQEQKIEQIQNARVSYHPSCLSEHEYKHLKVRVQKRSNSHWQVSKTLHSNSFQKIQNHVDEAVIQNRELKSLSDIYAMYEAIFEEEQIQSKLDLFDTKFRPHHLLKKLFEAFPVLTKTAWNIHP